MSQDFKNLSHLVANINRIALSEIEKETMQRVIDELRASLEELAALKASKPEEKAG